MVSACVSLICVVCATVGLFVMIVVSCVACFDFSWISLGLSVL